MKLVPFRIDKSTSFATFQVINEMIKRIEECGLFIADLSETNANVCQEIGYIMGYTKGKELTQKAMLILRHKKNEKNVDEKVPFNLRNFDQLRFSDIRVFKKKIRQRIKDCYSL